MESECLSINRVLWRPVWPRGNRQPIVVACLLSGPQPSAKRTERSHTHEKTAHTLAQMLALGDCCVLVRPRGIKSIRCDPDDAAL